jgi:hypothetical protein
MRRKASKLVLMSAGAALAWFLDPVSGADRRRQVTERLSGLTGGPISGGDPTGGAAPPAVAAVQPTPTPTPTPAAPADDPDLVQALEAASGGEKLFQDDEGPARAQADEADRDRAAIRTSW